MGNACSRDPSPEASPLADHSRHTSERRSAKPGSAAPNARAAHHEKYLTANGRAGSAASSGQMRRRLQLPESGGQRGERPPLKQESLSLNFFFVDLGIRPLPTHPCWAMIGGLFFKRK